MKRLTCIAAVGSLVLLTACATGRSPVSPGLLYTGVEGSESVGPSEKASKEGSACATNVLGLIAVGDASIDAAAKKGRINSIRSVDYSTTSVLSLFATSCTIVHGE